MRYTFLLFPFHVLLFITIMWWFVGFLLMYVFYLFKGMGPTLHNPHRAAIPSREASPMASRVTAATASLPLGLLPMDRAEGTAHPMDRSRAVSIGNSM